uniref:Immunoglobulin V-set domain-containing protein n=1 Tax=Anopheles minimus TaxID=112268 RepID=A0A182WPM9_9DIPT
MYTNDERFAILHTPGSNTWTLQIKFVQRRDHGTYECQSLTLAGSGGAGLSNVPKDAFWGEKRADVLLERSQGL